MSLPPGYNIPSIGTQFVTLGLLLLATYVISGSLQITGVIAALFALMGIIHLLFDIFGV